MSTIKLESGIIDLSELKPLLEERGLPCSTEQLTEPHRGAVDSVLHFMTENMEVLQFFVGFFGAFGGWLKYQKVQLEKRKDARDAEKHQVEMELKRLEVLEKKASLRVTLKNRDILILPNGTEEEIAQQIEREAPGLKASQIKQIELK